jgi:hypothetical protein
MKNAREYKCIFSDFQIYFAASLMIYMDSCYHLLSPLNLPNDQMNDLLVERQIVAWTNTELQQYFKKRLGPRYNIYVLLVMKLHRRIFLFCRKLQLNNDLNGRIPNVIIQKRLTAF